MRTLPIILLAGLAIVAAWQAAAHASGEAIVAGSISARATFEHIGVVWEVSGDTDLDSEMTLEFRELGATAWRQGAPAVRAHPDLIVNGEPLGLDSWAASAMWLAPGTTYEMRATLADPDGGGTTAIITADTRRRPVPSTTSRHVIPGSGGGSGAITDPYRGLQSAADAAVPGDTFHVAAGTYDPFELMASGTDGEPISFIGPTTGPAAIIDGAGTDRGIVTLGSFDAAIAHVIVEHLTIRDGHWGIDAQNTQDIVIANVVIEDVDDGIVNRRGNGWESNQTVCDNTITGRTPWPGSGIPGERGIDLKGDGNVVCHNLVQDFGDCVSVQPSTGPSYGNDVYGNHATRCVDDGIEVDYNQANVRVWRNLVMNSRTGVSVQPIRGGPAYILRNEFFNLESAPIKMHNDTTGFMVAHNSGVKNGNAYGDNGAMWRNVTLRNNLFVGTRYAFEFTTVRDEGYRDFDHNAWSTDESDQPGGPWFKWENVRYDHIEDLPAGVEDQGLEISPVDLVDATLPASWDIEALAGHHDLRPTGAQLADRGAILPNLNDPFVVDGAPDLGAFEAGMPMPGYGPGGAVIGPFTDVPATYRFATEIAWLAEAGITAGCNPPFADRFCPERAVTRGQMASFLVRALGLPPATADHFTDDNGGTHEANINALAEAEITLGCTPTAYCPHALISRAQMASLLVRALDLPAEPADRFVDDDGSTHEANINALARAGITTGCTATTFCPGESVIRAHMAAFLYRALSGE